MFILVYAWIFIDVYTYTRYARILGTPMYIYTFAAHSRYSSGARQGQPFS